MVKIPATDAVPFFGPFVRNAYNYDVKLASDETGLFCPEPTLTQQQFKDDSDPNTIMATFARTQDVSLLQVKSPGYGDFTGVGDYQSALNAVIAAQEGFNQLPANVRARFENDPGQLLDFLSDGANLKEAIELGLITPKPGEDLSPTGGRSPKSSKEPVGGKSAGKQTPAQPPSSSSETSVEED